MMPQLNGHWESFTTTPQSLLGWRQMGGNVKHLFDAIPIRRANKTSQGWHSGPKPRSKVDAVCDGKQAWKKLGFGW